MPDVTCLTLKVRLSLSGHISKHIYHKAYLLNNKLFNYKARQRCKLAKVIAAANGMRDIRAQPMAFKFRNADVKDGSFIAALCKVGGPAINCLTGSPLLSLNHRCHDCHDADVLM